MKLEFNSVDELGQFLNFAWELGSARAQARGLTDVSVPAADGGPFVGKVATTAGVGDVAFDMPQQPLRPTASVDGAGNITLAGPHDALQGDSETSKIPDAGKPARRRRTKAEIEADEKAAAAAELAKAQQTGQVQTETAPNGANPFEQPATDGAMTSAPNDGTAPTGDAAGEEVVTPFQHLTRAREFIGKHGMQKYNESFAKAGLDPNVMAYTAYQRALHIDALAALEAD